jgi:hypothetical protein
MNVSFYRELSARIQSDRQQSINAAQGSIPFYSGRLDLVNCRRIAGWATRTPRPPTSLNVDIYDGGRVMGTVTADIFRPDVYQAGAGPLFCGFDFPTPASFQDGRPHSITLKIAGSSQDLIGSPYALTCNQIR